MISRREGLSRSSLPRRGEIGSQRRMYMSRSHRTKLYFEEEHLDRMSMPERSSSMRRLSNSFGVKDSSSKDNMDGTDASDVSAVTGRAALSSRSLVNRLSSFRRSKKDVTGDDRMDDHTRILRRSSKSEKLISMKETKTLFKPFKSLRRLIGKSMIKGSGNNNNNNNDNSNNNKRVESNTSPLITNDDSKLNRSFAILMVTRELQLMDESESEHD
ncbi:MAG: hypothetical protein ACI90V_010173 [Bacillariaceae sp.]|jgi:hypothetical protein